MKKVLITGCQGQDGILLSNLFLKKNFAVYGFVKKKKKGIKNVNYKVNNLKSKKKIFNHLKNIKPDIIIHLASSNSSYYKRKTTDSYKINYSQNLKITKNLIDAIIKTKFKLKFIFAGSSVMFAAKIGKTLNEKDIFKTINSDYYGKYKIDSYKYILKMKKKFSFNASTAILFNHDSIYRNKKFLVPKLIKAFKQKNLEFIKKIYSLDISGDFSHAEDICNGIYKLSLLKRNIDKIILSSGKRFYLNNVIKYLQKYFNLEIQTIKINKTKNFKIIGSNLLAKKMLGYKTKKNLINVCREILSNYS